MYAFVHECVHAFGSVCVGCGKGNGHGGSGFGGGGRQLFLKKPEFQTERDRDSYI